MAEWAWVRLEELAAPEKSAISKPYGSAIVKEDYLADGVPVVRGVNLANGIFHDDDFVFISEELADSMPGSRLGPGDLVFTHRGSVGQVSMIPRYPRYQRYAVSTSQVKARLDPTRAVPEYYYYWFKSPQGQHSIVQGSSTVGVPGLAQPVATIKALSVPYPSLEEQQAIAATLCTLDDKIECNRRASRLSLELAGTHFHAASASSGRRRLGDVATLVLGGTPDRKRPEYWDDGTIPWINSGCANEEVVLEPSELITEASLAGSAAKLMPEGATIIAITGATLGQAALLGISTAGNQSLVGVWADTSELTTWLHFAVRSSIPELLGSATGAAQQHVNKGDIADLLVPIADPEVMQDWARLARPLVARAVGLQREILALRQLRDWLLPQLMSGGVRVPEACEAVQETMR